MLSRKPWKCYARMYNPKLKKLAVDRVYFYTNEPSFEFFCACRNRSCADEVDLFIRKEDEFVKEMRYRGEGCLFSHASAHVICELARNKTKTSLQSIVAECLASTNEEILHEILHIFQGIPRDSSRTKCYRYIWETVNERWAT